MGPGESQCWSLEDGTWSTSHDLVGDRYGSSFCLVPDKLVVLGGGYDDDSTDTKYMDKKHSVCLVSTRWTCGTRMEPAMMMVGIWYLATVS